MHETFSVSTYKLFGFFYFAMLTSSWALWLCLELSFRPIYQLSFSSAPRSETIKKFKGFIYCLEKIWATTEGIWFIDAKSFCTLVCLKISWVFRKILNKFSWQVCELSLVFDSNIIIYNMVNKNTLPLPQQHYHPFYQRSFCHPCWVVPKIVIKIVILLFIFYKSVGTIYQFKMHTGIW